MVSRPLDGVRVLEFGNLIAGPYCGMLLGDMGADLIKIEAPSHGDMSRVAEPKVAGESLPFVSLNRNKRSIVIDLKLDEGVAIVERLAKEADVVLENFRPGVMDGLGLGAERLRSLNSKLVYVAVSGFGQTGPHRHRAAVNLIIEAFAGTLSVTGEPGQVPTRPGIQTGDIIGALFATYAVLSGLVGRFKHGEGRTADLSLVEASLAAAAWETADYLQTGRIPQPLGARHRFTAPYQLFEAMGGRHIAIGAPSDAMFEKIMTVLGHPEFCQDPHFSTYNTRKKNEDAIVDIVGDLVRSWDADRLEEALVAAGVPCSKVNNYGEALHSTQLTERSIIQEIHHPKIGAMNVVRNPVLFTQGGPAVSRPAPVLGQHSCEILVELGYTNAQIQALRDRGVVQAEKARK